MRTEEPDIRLSPVCPVSGCVPMSDTACSWAMYARGQQSSGVFNQVQFILLVSIPTVLVVQDSQFTIDKIWCFPLCVQEKQTHRAGRLTSKPPSCLMLLHQRQSLQYAWEGSHHHRIKWTCSRDGERLSWGLLVTESPGHHLNLWQLTMAPEVGEGWESWPAPAPYTSLCIKVTLPAPSLPNLPPALPLPFSCFYFVLFRAAFCCSTGCVRAIKTHQCVYIYTIKQQNRIQRSRQPNKCITTSLIF